MKATLLVALAVLAVMVGADSVKNVGGLEIHIFDVGQAMSQLWIYPSGYTVFVDGPEEHWNSGALAKVLAGKITNLLNGTKVIDVGVISHLHCDHVGYPTHGGFWALIETYGITFKKIIDRDSGHWADRNKPCNLSTILFNNVGTVSNAGNAWICYATDPSSKVYKIREIAKLCSTSQISPPDNGASVTIVTVDAIGAMMKDGRPVPGDHLSQSFPPSENDYSIGLVARYGSFTFSTFGDLDGEYAKSENGYMYDDIESAILHRIGETDVYNVNHHGSSHSSNANFLNVLKPTVSVISCGEKNTYGHPAQETLDRLAKVSDHIYVTERGNPSASYGKAVVTNDDIVIHVSPDTKTYTVSYGNSVQKFNSKNANQPKCKK